MNQAGRHRQWPGNVYRRRLRRGSTSHDTAAAPAAGDHGPALHHGDPPSRAPRNVNKAMPAERGETSAAARCPAITPLPLPAYPRSPLSPPGMTLFQFPRWGRNGNTGRRSDASSAPAYPNLRTRVFFFLKKNNKKKKKKKILRQALRQPPSSRKSTRLAPEERHSAPSCSAIIGAAAGAPGGGGGAAGRGRRAAQGVNALGTRISSAGLHAVTGRSPTGPG